MTTKNIYGTANEFASVSSIHGVFYVFSSGIPLVDRLLWSVLVIVGIVIATLFCQESYRKWMENPVITVLDDTSKSIRDINFPAITICSHGLNMIAMEKVVQRNFENWKEENKRIKRNVGCADQKEMFLRDKFKLLSENQNIFSIIKTFFARHVDDFIRTDGVRENLLTCMNTGEDDQTKEKERRKRSTTSCEGTELSTPISCSMSSYTQSQGCDCGQLGKILKMESKYSALYQDRTWSIACENIAKYQAARTGSYAGSIAADWEISPYTNNAFVSGLSSTFRPYKRDRRYRVHWSRNDSFTVGNCGQWLQVMNGNDLIVGGLASDEVIGAIKSTYLSLYLDRQFYVKICKLSSKS